MKVFHAIRVVSFSFPYDVVLILTRVLAPTLFHIILHRFMYAEERPMICYIKSLGKTALVDCEVCVFKGHHAVSILNALTIKTLSFVGPYMPYMKRGGLTTPIAAKKIAIRALAKFKEKTMWVDASELSGNLDFVYVKGRRDYVEVKTDL